MMHSTGIGDPPASVFLLLPPPVAPVVVFLASALVRMVTGAMYDVTQGFTDEYRQPDRYSP